MGEIKELADIKPYLTIEDYSFYWLSAIIFFAVVLLALLLWIAISRFLEYKKKNRDKFYLRKIQSVDWKDAKQAAYEVTYFGRLITKDKRSKEIYDQLLPLLECYKYKKEIPKLDKQSLSLYNLFVQVLDESI
jgi:hypothetical protein